MGLLDLWNDFSNIVEHNFKYLETDFKFKRRIELPFVWYESPVLKIGLYYDPWRWHELDISIVPIQMIDLHLRSFSVAQLVKLNDIQTYNDVFNKDQTFPHTKGDIELYVNNLATMLHKYGSNILRGDLKDLRRLAKLLLKEAKQRYPK